MLIQVNLVRFIMSQMYLRKIEPYIHEGLYACMSDN